MWRSWTNGSATTTFGRNPVTYKMLKQLIKLTANAIKLSVILVSVYRIVWRNSWTRSSNRGLSTNRLKFSLGFRCFWWVITRIFKFGTGFVYLWLNYFRSLGWWGFTFRSTQWVICHYQREGIKFNLLFFVLFCGFPRLPSPPFLCSVFELRFPNFRVVCSFQAVYMNYLQSTTFFYNSVV